MFEIKVETIKGTQKEYVYGLNEIPFYTIMMQAKVSKKRGINYLEIPCAFDIETTNYYKRDENGNIDSDSFRPFSFMYHWQFCIDKYVVFGRTWEEFQKLIDTISNKMNLGQYNRLAVYVHNLNFEWQHMRFFINYAGGFFKDERRPLKILTAEGIEFRDSYALSNMNLKKFCENERDVTHYKLSGDDFNYDIVRTPETPLTNDEMAYCYNDVRGLAECISSRMRSDTLAQIPMTSTGYVRRQFRAAMQENRKNRLIFVNAKYNEHIYTLLRKAFRGGDTHANVRCAGEILKDLQSFDISSSYPGVMMTEQMPMGKFTRCSVKKWKSGWCEKNNMAYLIRCRFWDIRFKGKDHYDPYIPFSQCVAVRNHKDELEQENIYDNGRIIYAQAIELVLTDIDWKIVKDCYTWGQMAVKEIWCSAYAYLPDEFRSELRKLFKEKTALKGVEGKEYEYMRSKNRINACYGMMVQKIIEDETLYCDGEYETKTFNLAEQIDKYFRSRSNFLLYQWGVWVTSHARKRLNIGINAVGRNAIYWDTDSVKCFKNDFRETFEKINQEFMQKAIDNEAFADDNNGKRHYMGVFEYEETYKRFITLGAKKYLVENEKGEIYSTIAGVSKDKGAEFFRSEGMEAFQNGTVIPNSGHLVAYYNDDRPHQVTIEGCTFTTASNIALVDDTYTIGITGEYLALLDRVLNNSYDLIYN